MKDLLERVFKLKENGTNVKTEIIGGLTTFVTFAYALLVIPNILKIGGMNVQGIKGNAAEVLNIASDPIIASAFASVCISAAIGTLIMAFHANLPFVLAPGLGLVAFFAYNICLKMDFTWQQGLAAVFISGILFIIITFTSLREKIVKAIPQNLKFAITAGIGLFISLIGLKSGGIIVANPSTLVAFGDFTNKAVILTIIGLVISLILMAKNIKGAMLIGIVITTIIGIPMGVTSLEGAKVFSFPHIGETFFALDLKGLLTHNGNGIVGALLTVFMVVITLSLVDLFDGIGTLVGTAQSSGMVDENGEAKGLRKALASDAVATTCGAMLGTTTLATVVESAAGIAAGARTGLSNVVVSIMLLVSLFFSGVIGVIPQNATSPALIIVGVLMMGAVKEIEFSDFTEAVPAFLTIALMPFTYSIANGIAAGMIFYPIMKVSTGRGKEVHKLLYIFAILFIIRFILMPD
ncbi:guanine permease [Clostridium botulinum]|uniref:NCS2 family permease n=1 Tax=Clostridium botulinum TaxID=1491 RepID=UPI000174E2C7|nr:NCS2 family permease [Clostridium botulinum]ACD53654.1 inner membrane protein YicO [Clostridium botulinum E3 str. Alaska E43]AJF29392.1 guanine permease [Clostridium botulinum]AJF32453.1 guanine permease [Clostridium botulinum]KIL09624.1 guanine permease [Clostridium botulinum]MBN1077389.1 NCS2 family permease [Clostridium botulinum]